MMLSVDELFYRYRARNSDVLKGVSFEVRDGDLLCVLGPNGCGKTTLFKCLLGLFQPSAGRVMIDERNINSMRRQEYAQKVSYIPQAHTPVFNYSVLDVVLMGRSCYVGSCGRPSEKDYAFAYEALATMNISYLKNKGYGEISGGERQLTLVARAIVQQARILIMDEPTSNLDYGNQVAVLKEVKRLCSECGYIIIMSSHNPDHAFTYANKVLLMKAGRVLAHGDPSQVVDVASLESLYRVRMEIVNLPKKYCRGPERKVCIPVLEDENCNKENINLRK